MDQQTWAYIDIRGDSQLVGRLWARERHGRESASFQYDDAWLQHPERFALEPALMLGSGTHHTPMGKALFGALGDSAPDRWGRILMGRAERQAARAESRSVRTLNEIDYLLQVNDRTRQGALRFSREAEGEFLTPSGDASVPPLIDLPRLLAASESVLADEEGDELLQLLLAPGSSLGGARPKASVLDGDGTLSIAKFPKHDDEIDTVRWEAVALSLAAQASIEIPIWRLETIENRPVLILRRFDREDDQRIPFLSAMSMIGAEDGQTRSYLEIADALRQHGADVKNDLHALWRRMVFNILISNTDDHLRNHGFLYVDNSGWQLSPAYDLNPIPVDIKPRFLSTAIDMEDTTASIELAFESSEYFMMEKDEARAIASDVARAVNNWKEVAADLGISSRETKRMSSAFEHEDLLKALT
jgi:serine/threonine-protein kinase HipA